jgi:hypothetical protein
MIGPGIIGDPINTLNTLALMMLVAFWQFIPVYSSMVLPPAWILESAQRESPQEKPRWSRGFLPLLWLIPFTLYLLIIIFVMSFLGT